MFNPFKRKPSTLAERLCDGLGPLFQAKIDDPLLQRVPRNQTERFRCATSSLLYGFVQSYHLAAAHRTFVDSSTRMMNAMTEVHGLLLTALCANRQSVRVAERVVNPMEILYFPEVLNKHFHIPMTPSSFDTDSVSNDVLLRALLILRLRAATEDFDYAVKQTSDPDERIKAFHLKQADTFILNVRGPELLTPDAVQIANRQVDLLVISTFLENYELEIADVLRRT